MHLIWPRSYGAVSVDMICKAAHVFKGSFYHFFPTKADLMVASLEHYWSRNQAHYLRSFASPTPPLEQIRNYFLAVEKRQRERRKQYGRVVGCPYMSIGCEVSQQEPAIGHKIRDLMSRSRSYLERAIQEANRDGSASTPDPAAKARELYALLEGTLTEARIRNDVGVIKGIADRAVLLVSPAGCAPQALHPNHHQHASQRPVSTPRFAHAPQAPNPAGIICE